MTKREIKVKVSKATQPFYIKTHACATLSLTLSLKAFLESDTAKKNMLKSYKLMLDFYGIRLKNEKTGEVKRALNWAERFENLNM